MLRLVTWESVYHFKFSLSHTVVQEIQLSLPKYVLVMAMNTSEAKKQTKKKHQVGCGRLSNKACSKLKSNDTTNLLCFTELCLFL
mmetsp:Transcript_2631/g.3505  ORF Transcript_2631/g.3505 Transcript_2631/m.3505 type:complete len:85 (-) Transcript_2631:4-258(-)